MSDKYTLIAAEYAASIAAPAADAPTLTKMCLWIGVSKSGFYEAYAKVSLKKYKPMAARNEARNVSSGLL